MNLRLKNKKDRNLTFSGTERLAVRMIASAIPWAYQGYKETKLQNQRHES